MVLAPLPRVHAQETLLVRSTEPGAPWALEVEAAVLGELRARGRDVVLPTPAPLPEVPALEPALSAFHDLRPEDAWRGLSVWAEAAARSASLPPEERARGHVWRARVLLALSREGVAESLDAALAADPTLALDATVHPPPLREALELRRRALRTATATLRVEPASASLRVDGRRLTAGEHELPVGEHVVGAEAPQCHAEVRRWRLPREGGTLTLRLLPRAGAPSEPLPERTAREIGDRRPLLLDATRDDDGIRLQLLEREGEVRRAGPGSDPRRLALALFRPRPVPPARAAPAAVAPAEMADAEAESALDPWWVVGAGVGAAVLGALAIGLIVGLQSPDGFDAVGTPVP